MDHLLNKNMNNDNDFEKWIVDKFNQNIYSFEEWQSDNLVNDIYANTELVSKFKICCSMNTGESKCFAIVCVWLENFNNGYITWAKEYPINGFNGYAEKLNFPVYILLGIDGYPSDPLRFFIIPLNKISTCYFDENELDSFSQNYLNKEFSFDFKTNILSMETPAVFDWAIYIDIEGFSDKYKQDRNLAKKSVIKLTELICEVAKKNDYLKITQFGSDGFLIIQKGIYFGYIDSAIEIAAFLMQNMLFNGFATKSKISSGVLDDITNDYPDYIKNELGYANTIAIGNSLIRLTPFIGDSIINSYTLNCARGPLMVLDKTLNINSCISTAIKKLFYDIGQDKLNYVKWLGILPHDILDDKIANNRSGLISKMKEYLANNELKDDWKKNAETLLWTESN